MAAMMDRAMSMKIMRREKIIRQYRWEALGIVPAAGRVVLGQPG